MNSRIRTLFYILNPDYVAARSLRSLRSRKGVRILEFITFYQNAMHLTRVHCATFYQSTLRHELSEDVTSPREDSSEKGLMVVMFCSDLPVKKT